MDPLIVSAMSLQECLASIALCHHLDFDRLFSYVEEDTWGGRFEGYGDYSITREEGQVMYALNRYFNNINIIEIGTAAGCSTNHLAWAAQKVAGGYVCTIDNAEYFVNPGTAIDPCVRMNIAMLRADLFRILPLLNSAAFDFMFEDSAHLISTTMFCMNAAKRILAAGSFIAVHDTLCLTPVNDLPCWVRVQAGIEQAGLEKKFVHYKIGTSPYGLGICRFG